MTANICNYINNCLLLILIFIILILVYRNLVSESIDQINNIKKL